MSEGFRSLPGTIFTPQFVGGFSLLRDDAATSWGVRTPGVMRTAQLVSTPSQSGRWTIHGWSLQLRVGILKVVNGGANKQTWGTFGRLTAGLAVNAGLSSLAVASLPADLSTFTEVWNPNENPGSVLAGFDTNELAYMPIGVTYFFPSPLITDQGAQLQFALIMTPSLLGMQPGVDTIGPSVRSANFTLLYSAP